MGAAGNEPTAFEAAMLRWIAERYPGRFEPRACSVVRRNHTGAGMYVYLAPDEGQWDRPPLDGPLITSTQLEHGGGCLLWMSAGRPACLECFAYGSTWPHEFVDYEITPLPTPPADDEQAF